MLELLVFINQSLYCASFIPQIIKNIQVKSGESLSDLYLLMSINSFVALSIYFFCLHLPFGYKFFAIGQLIATLVLIGQRFLYSLRKIYSVIVVYLINFFLIFVSLFFASMYPLVVGNIAGWVALMLLIVCRLPQIAKIYYEKAVGDFSIYLVLLFGFASGMEVSLAIIYKLPIQLLCTSSWAFFTFMVMLVQFLLYGVKSKHN